MDDPRPHRVLAASEDSASCSTSVVPRWPGAEVDDGGRRLVDHGQALVEMDDTDIGPSFSGGAARSGTSVTSTEDGGAAVIATSATLKAGPSGDRGSPSRPHDPHAVVACYRAHRRRSARPRASPGLPGLRQEPEASAPSRRGGGGRHHRRAAAAKGGTPRRPSVLGVGELESERKVARSRPGERPLTAAFAAPGAGAPTGGSRRAPRAGAHAAGSPAGRCRGPRTGRSSPRSG